MFRLIRRTSGIPVRGLVAAGILIVAGSLTVVAIWRPHAHGTTPSRTAAMVGVVAERPSIPTVLDRASPTAAPISVEHQAASQPPSEIAVRTGTAANATLQLGPADNGAALTVSAGTVILVRLPGVPRFRWTIPTSSNGDFLRLVSGEVGSDGSAQASFVAVGSSQAFLSAVDNPLCFPICELPPGGGWRVTIVVK